jgi:hypothetical protein
VSAFTAVDADAVDNSALFRLVNKDSYSLPSALETIDGTAFPAGTVVTLQGGYATVAEIPPEMTGIILQITSRLYEFRENAVAFSINQMPMWMNDLLVGLWQPRC